MRKRHRQALSVELLEDRLTPSFAGSPWPDPGHLTLSFAPDGTDAGGTPSGLFQKLNAAAPAANWEMEILRAFQSWAVNSNVNIGVVPDGGQPLGTTGAVEGDPRFGDIRIASKSLAPSAVSTAQPFSWSGTTWSGDMLLNSLYNFGIGGSGQYDLYTIALHEAGHTLGVGDNTADTGSAMFDAYLGPRSGLGSEDITNIQSLYGVRQAGPFAANNSFASAAFVTNSPSSLSFSGDISTSGEADYFKIVAPNVLLGLTSLTVQLKTSGISLLEPNLSVYNASHQLVGSAAATSPLNGDVSVTIRNPVAGATYYFRVAGNTNDVFGIGGYQANVSYQSLLGSLTGLLTSVLPIVGNTLSNALQLSPAFPNKTDDRFDYLYKATIALPFQTDYYQIQSPNGPAGTTYTTHALAWELSPNGLHPIIHVFDAQHNPVAVQVLGNSDGMYSLQIPNTTANSTYYVEVTAMNQLGANSLGSYAMGVKFDSAAPVSLTTIATSSLATQTSTDSGTLTMTQNGLFHFQLGAWSDASWSRENITLSIYDQNGNLVFSFDASTGLPPSTAVVYLQAGTYTTQVGVHGSNGYFQPINYSLSGEILSDPIGPYQSNPTNNSRGSTGSSGGGYYYSGPSSSNTTGKSGPNYY
jgi:hypothetical protein